MSTMRNFYIVATYENATKLVGINKDGNTKEVIDAGAISSNALIQSHALFDSSLFITGSKNSYGALWKIDERNLQTEELKPSNNSYFNPSQVVSTSVGVIFSAFDADGVQQLWRYTANGGLSIVDDPLMKMRGLHILRQWGIRFIFLPMMVFMGGSFLVLMG